MDQKLLYMGYTRPSVQYNEWSFKKILTPNLF